MVGDGRMLQLLQILLQASHTLQRMLQKILRLLTFYLKREYFYMFSLTLYLTMFCILNILHPLFGLFPTLKSHKKTLLHHLDHDPGYLDAVLQLSHRLLHLLVQGILLIQDDQGHALLPALAQGVHDNWAIRGDSWPHS